ncbi:hypothetical protein UJ101_00085 [Flavobacteriaceae bacterium UJ101]|nr:hypothetical protein UJ101_00085 [Flavobacteriaceae bacterium UJ101]
MSFISKIIMNFKPKKYINYRYLYHDIEGAINNKKIINSSSSIIISPIQFGDNFFYIKKKYPNHTLNFFKGNQDIKILSFKIKTHNIKIYCKVHFYLNKVFLIRYKIPYINQYDQLKINRFFNIKYLQQQQYRGTEIIKGNSGNLILISNNVNYTINYIEQRTLHLINNTTIEEVKSSSIKRAYS